MVNPSGTDDDTTPTLSHKVVRGSVFVFAMRWTVRLLGIVSIAFLARMLDREDFGLVAMAMALIALPQTLADMGVERAIIREHEPTADIYNTAFTIRLMQMAVIAGLLFIAAPYIADFYQDPRMTMIVRILSLSLLIQGFENIWIVRFWKTYQFKYDFLYMTARKFFSVVITVALAFVLQSYWALVYGQLAGSVIRVVLSFLIAPAHVRVTLSEWRRIWSFSQWNLLRGIAVYVVRHGDRLILGRLLTAEIVGLYTVAREIAEMPRSEISAPINRALAPGFSEMQTEPVRLASALGKSLGAVATILLPLAFGLAVTAEQLVPVALGPGWEDAVPVIQILAISAIVPGISSVMGTTLSMTGYVRATAGVMWARAIVIMLAGVPATYLGGMQGMALALVGGEVATCAAMAFYYRRFMPQFRAAILMRVLVRPFAAAALMVLAVFGVAAFVEAIPLVLLLVKTAVGAVVYTGSLYLSWRFAGRPDGIEKIVFNRLHSLIQPNR